MASQLAGQEGSVCHLEYPQDAMRGGGLMSLKHITTPAHPLEGALAQVRCIQHNVHCVRRGYTYLLMFSWENLPSGMKFVFLMNLPS
jgi:hypothetical protein